MKLSALVKLFPVFFLSGISMLFLRLGHLPMNAFADNLNPSLLTRQHIETYKEMEKRMKNLQVKESSLESKEKFIHDQEDRVNKKLESLKKLSNWIHKVLATVEESHENNLNKLVKSLESMNAEDAGRILNGLSLDSLLFITKKMKANKLSSILKYLDAEKSQVLLQFSIAQVQAIKRAPTLGNLKA